MIHSCITELCYFSHFSYYLRKVIIYFSPLERSQSRHMFMQILIFYEHKMRLNFLITLIAIIILAKLANNNI